MLVFKQFLNFYINTSIHVAVAVFSLAQMTKLSLNILSDSEIDFFIFFGTILGYNFLKYFEVFWNRKFTFKKNYSIVVVTLIASFGVVYYFLELQFSIQIEFLKIGIMVLIYPFIRKFGLIKMIFVSFCLTLVTVYIPSINYSLNWVYCLQRFLIVFCLLIPLEICDLELDSRTLKTLPKIIGIHNLKIFGYFLLVIFYFLNFQLSNFILAIAIALSILFSNGSRTKYYTSFWVESIPVFGWFLLLFIK